MVIKSTSLPGMICIALLITGAGIVQADTAVTEWVARYDGPAAGYDAPRDITVDDAGNVYVTGNTDTGDEPDFVTIKYDAEGNQLWAATYDGPGTGYGAAEGVVVDSAGNVFVTGTMVGAFGNRDHATIKYDPDGNELWVVTHNGVGNDDDEASVIALDGSGGVYVGGGTNVDGWNNRDMIVTRIDADGNIIWSSTYNGPVNGGEGATSIVLDGNGYLYVSGTSSGVNNFDYAVVKFDTDGNQIWASRYDGPALGADYCRGIVLNGTGEVVATGYSYSGEPTGWDYATVAFAEADGAIQWTAYYDCANAGDQATSIVSDGAGRVCISGFSEDSGGNYDMATVMYDAAGAQVWAARYAGPFGGDDWGEAIAMDSAGNVYIAGESDTTGYYYDFTTIKYTADGAEEWVERYNHTGTGYDAAYELAVDAGRNVYSCGTTSVSGNADLTTIKYSQVAPSTVDCSLTCLPDFGYIPFPATITVGLVNNHNNPRLVAARVDLTLANGTFYSSYRRGYTAVPGLATRYASWSQNLNSGAVIGTNEVLLTVEDVTPAPYNQPPGPPSGDTATGTCAVTAEYGE